MKIMTVLGTRPEIIRLSLVIKKLDEYGNHVLVHTGQNHVEVLNEIFFKDLSLRKPDHFLDVRGDTFGEQLGHIVTKAEKVLLKERPDRLVVLGDTNSGLVAIVAKRMGIPVFHLEAGNRCYDDRVPEEINRRVIDHSSSVLLPYTHRSKENLIREGIERSRIYVIGNPIYEVLETYAGAIRGTDVHARLHLEENKYFLVTIHRAENVDHKERLESLLSALEVLARKYGLPVVCSLHPRTKSKMKAFGFADSGGPVSFIEPLGFTDFVALEKSALCVLTDSGTVQEECCILRVPNVTVRDVTERPETIETGSNVLTGMAAERIVLCVDVALREDRQWDRPAEYMDRHVSAKVVKILMGYERLEEPESRSS
ncbi:MAG: UDP-N-acetylglucosamine 2-epimerase (non-hydrolyzing) [Chloroflexi bacterium]|nr:MAG: UDP-N-acetylglucosamine 2-epimerase (non-hydrolyzing) [Chloroflexota bacterium]